MATDPFYRSATTASQSTASGMPAGGEVASVYDDPGYGIDEALDAFTGRFDVAPPVDSASLGEFDVTLVLVAHNASRWLPRTLDGIAGLDRLPDRIVAVDTGSRDETASLLASTLGAQSVITVPRTSGFGAAIARGVATADQMATASVGGWPGQATQGSHQGTAAYGRQEWLWILHDDSAPAPDALRRLLETAVRRPDAGVIGPKVVSWSEDRQLLEVGFSVTGGGRRHTALDRREYDQGQHDTPRDVLAVGTAGMLIRRDVWDELDGFDPVITMFRDDLDFGWRANQAGHAVIANPDAVVFHAEAAAHGRRRISSTRIRPHLADRRNAVYVLLANCAALTVPLVFLRLLLGSAARAAGFLLGKQPALAFEELVAVLAVLARPDRLISARLRRRRTRRKTAADLRGLFPPPGQQLRRASENVLGFISGSAGHDVSRSARRASTGADDDDELTDEDDSLLLRMVTHPGVLLVSGLVVASLIAARSLIGAGRLAGGALLPAPNEVSNLWELYTESWHGVSLGSPTESPPYVAVVAAVASVVRSAPLAVDLLLLASVPLAGLTAYLLLRKISDSPWLRVWGSVTYALLPAITGAVAAGRLGTAVAAVLTPLVVLALWRTLGSPGSPGPFRASWSAGLLLAAVTAFVPVAWLIALVLGIVAGTTILRDRPSLLRIGTALVVAPAVLMPWTFAVLRDPVLMFAEAGMPGPALSDPALAPWAVALAHPGGPGAAPVWLGAGLALAAWTSLLRRDSRLLIVVAWVVAGVALAVGVVMTRIGVTGPTLESSVAAWPGFPVVLLAGAFVVASVSGVSGVRDYLSKASFGWRQPVALVVVTLAVATPVVAAGWWISGGADDPIDRRDASVLPAYVADDAERSERVRTLLLDRADDGRVTYSLLRASGPRLGDAETGSKPDENSPLRTVVADLVSGRGAVDGSRLAEFAAKYVYLPRPFDRDLADGLDVVPGLVRASAPEGAAMWKVDAPVSRLWIEQDGQEPVGVPSGRVDARASIPEGDDGRTLVLAELTDDGWSATLNGKALKATTYNGWGQAFELPAEGGKLTLSHRGEERQNWLWFQLVAVGVAVVLAAPGMRRDKGAIDAAAELDLDDSGEIPVAHSVDRRNTDDLKTQPIATSPPRELSTELIGQAKPVDERGSGQANVTPATVTAPPVQPPTPEPQPDVPDREDLDVDDADEPEQRGDRKGHRRRASKSSLPSMPSLPKGLRQGRKRPAGKRAKGRHANGGGE